MSQKHYRFIFTAEIGQFKMEAKVSCPITATWKRSSQSVTSSPVNLQNGSVNFQQSLKLPINITQDLDNHKYLEKKSLFTFTMHTPKGDKTAGNIYIDLSKILNEKMTVWEQDFILQKCPIKGAYCHIKIIGECIGQRNADQISLPGIPMSKQQINSQKEMKRTIIQKQYHTDRKNIEDIDQKSQQIRKLKAQVQKLSVQKVYLQKQLQAIKQYKKQQNKIQKIVQVDGDIETLKEQLLKSKNIQYKLEDEINFLKEKNNGYEQQLETIRKRFEKLYDAFCENVSRV